MDVERHAPAVIMFEKTGCPFLSCQGKPVSIKCSLNRPYREATASGVVNRHGG
jgi:hypothetical protein